MSVESPIARTDNVFIGEDRIFEYTVVDADGAAVNITNWQMEWVLRKSVADADPLLTKTVGSGITITNGPAGTCQVSLADADTYDDGADEVLIPAGRYVYALRRTDSTTETVLAFGDFVLQEAASR